jgi:hypothetical protein
VITEHTLVLFPHHDAVELDALRAAVLVTESLLT